jgi:hypothetical protein
MAEGEEQRFEDSSTMDVGAQPVTAESSGTAATGAASEDLSTSPAAEAPVEAVTQPSPIEAGDKNQSAQYLTESGKIKPEQAAVLQNLSQEKAKLISQMVDSGLFSGDDIELLAEMSEEELAQEIKLNNLKDASIDQMIRDGIFNEADRPQLQPLKLSELQGWLANYQEDPRIAQELNSVQRQQQEIQDIARGGEALPSVDEVSQEYLLEKAGKDVAKRELEFLGTGGLLDKAISDIVLPEVMRDVDKEFEKQFANEAVAEYKVLSTKDPAEITNSIYLDQDLKLLPQDEFTRLFIINKKDPVKNPGLKKEIEERVQQEVQRRVSVLRGRAVPEMIDAELFGVGSVEDSPAVQEMKKSMLEQMLRFGMFVKEQAITAGSEAFKNLLDLDFMTLFRAFIHGSGSYDVGRGGSLGYEDGGLVRHVSEDELLAKFKKPKELGQAIALAFLRSKEMQDMKFSVKQDVLDRAVEGDPAAIQEVMKAMVDHLHDGGSTDEKWKALRKGLGEGLYPGANARLDDKVQKLFVNDRGTELLRVMNLLMPSEGAGTSSKDGKNTRTGQNAAQAKVVPFNPQNSTANQPDTKAA